MKLFLTADKLTELLADEFDQENFHFSLIKIKFINWTHQLIIRSCYLATLVTDLPAGAAEGAGGFTFVDLPKVAPGWPALTLFPLVLDASETRLDFFIKYRVRTKKRIMKIMATVTIKIEPTHMLPDDCVVKMYVKFCSSWAITPVANSPINPINVALLSIFSQTKIFTKEKLLANNYQNQKQNSLNSSSLFGSLS